MFLLWHVKQTHTHKPQKGYRQQKKLTIFHNNILPYFSFLYYIVVNYDFLNSFSSWANVLRAATNKQKKKHRKKHTQTKLKLNV